MKERRRLAVRVAAEYARVVAAGRMQLGARSLGLLARMLLAPYGEVGMGARVGVGRGYMRTAGS